MYAVRTCEGIGSEGDRLGRACYTHGEFHHTRHTGVCLDRCCGTSVRMGISMVIAVPRASMFVVRSGQVRSGQVRLVRCAPHGGARTTRAEQRGREGERL
jgi:hypothetical protein